MTTAEDTRARFAARNFRVMGVGCWHVLLIRCAMQRAPPTTLPPNDAIPHRGGVERVLRALDRIDTSDVPTRVCTYGFRSSYTRVGR
eukprot:6326519-Prymnesium_polylepis.2